LPGSSLATVYLNVVSLVILWCTGSQSNHVFLEMMVCLAVLSTFSHDRSKWEAQATQNAGRST